MARVLSRQSVKPHSSHPANRQIPLSVLTPQIVISRTAIGARVGALSLPRLRVSEHKSTTTDRGARKRSADLRKPIVLETRSPVPER